MYRPAASEALTVSDELSCSGEAIAGDAAAGTVNDSGDRLFGITVPAAFLTDTEMLIATCGALLIVTVSQFCSTVLVVVVCRMEVELATAKNVRQQSVVTLRSLRRVSSSLLRTPFSDCSTKYIR